MQNLPDEIIFDVSQYISTPDEFFCFKSSSWRVHQLLPDSFPLSNIEQIKLVSDQIRHDKILIPSRMRPKFNVESCTLLLMLKHRVDSTMIALVASYMSGRAIAGIDFMSKMSFNLFINAVHIKSIEFGLRLLDGFSVPLFKAVFSACKRLAILDRIARYGSEYQVSEVLIRYPELFTPVMAKNVLNTVIRRGLLRAIWTMWRLEVDFATSNQGKYPIQAAVESENPAVVELLLRFGVPTSVRYRHDQSDPIHLAVRSGSLAITSLLLRHGARKDVKDFYGRTPLNIIEKVIRTETRNRQHKLDELFRIRELLLT
jgi:hypothetical protein